MQPVIAGRAEFERLGEPETVCVFVIDAAAAAAGVYMSAATSQPGKSASRSVCQLT